MTTTVVLIFVILSAAKNPSAEFAPWQSFCSLLAVAHRRSLSFVPRPYAFPNTGMAAPLTIRASGPSSQRITAAIASGATHLL